MRQKLTQGRFPAVVKHASWGSNRDRAWCGPRELYKNTLMIIIRPNQWNELGTKWLFRHRQGHCQINLEATCKKCQHQRHSSNTQAGANIEWPQILTHYMAWRWTLSFTKTRGIEHQNATKRHYFKHPAVVGGWMRRFLDLIFFWREWVFIAEFGEGRVK